MELEMRRPSWIILMVLKPVTSVLIHQRHAEKREGRMASRAGVGLMWKRQGMESL
jgi:hypothetical protein